MNSVEARRRLAIFRPGRDAGDPFFAEALALARSDDALAQWWEEEQAFDAALVQKLSEFRPPEALKAAILARTDGARTDGARNGDGHAEL